LRVWGGLERIKVVNPAKVKKKRRQKEENQSGEGTSGDERVKVRTEFVGPSRHRNARRRGTIALSSFEAWLSLSSSGIDGSKVRDGSQEQRVGAEKTQG